MAFVPVIDVDTPFQGLVANAVYYTLHSAIALDLRAGVVVVEKKTLAMHVPLQDLFKIPIQKRGESLVWELKMQVQITLQRTQIQETKNKGLKHYITDGPFNKNYTRKLGWGS